MMYRDEREALRDEVMQLRRELERARTDQERLAQVEKMLEVANREITDMRATMGGAPRRSRGPQSSAVLAIVAVVFLFAAGAGFFVAVRAKSATTPPVTQNAPTPDPLATIPPPTPEPAPTPVAAATPMAPPVAAKPAKSVHATWHATVTKSEGMPLAAGAPCTIEGNVVADSSGTGVDDVVLTCGGKKLYDDHDELEGMSSNDSDTKQFSGEKPGTWTYALVFSDVGARGPSKNQIAVDSTKQIGKVWSDNLPDFRVDFTIKPKSDPVDVELLTE